MVCQKLQIVLIKLKLKGVLVMNLESENLCVTTEKLFGLISRVQRFNKYEQNTIETAVQENH